MKNKIILILMLLLLIPSVSADIYIGNNTIIPGYFMGFMNFSYIQAFPAVPCTSSPAQYSRWNGTGFACFNDQSGSGGITSLTQGNGIILTPNPITSTGTVEVDTSFDFKNSTVANNTANWNNTFNGTYDGFLSLINSLQINDTNDRLYVNNTFLKIVDLNITIDRNLSNFTNVPNFITNQSAQLVSSSQVTGLDTQLYNKVNTPTDHNGTSGWYLVTNGDGSTTWTNLPPSGSTISYFFHNDTLTDVPYSSKNANRTINTSYTKAFKNITMVSGSSVLVQNWTTTQLNTTFIPAGVHLVHVDAVKIGSGGSHLVRLYYVCQIVNATGENLIVDGTSDYSPEITTSLTEADMDLVMMDMNINASDRMLVSLYAYETGSGAEPTLSVMYSDRTDARLILPGTQIDLTPILSNISILQSDVSNLKQNDSQDEAYVNATFEPKITGSTNNVFFNGLKQFVGLTYLNITGFNETVTSIVNGIGYLTNLTMDRNLNNFTNSPGFITNVSMDRKLSNFTNDQGFVSNTSVDRNLNNFTNSPGYLTNVTMDRKLSNFTNDGGFISNTTLDRKLSNFTNDSNWVNNATMDKNYNNLTNLPSFITNTSMDRNLSNFTNVPGFITSTYNTTYEGFRTSKEDTISGSTNNVFWNGLKNWISLTYLNVTGFNSTVQSIIGTYNYITNSTAQISETQVTNLNTDLNNKLTTTSLNTTMDRKLSNFTNDQNWISNTTMDRNLNNFTNSQNFISNTTLDRNLNNFTNSPGFVTNTTMDKAYNNMTNIPTDFANATVNTNDRRYSQVVAGINNGTLVVPTGIYFDMKIPYNATIVSADIVSDQSGSASVNVYKCTYAAFPCTTSIVGGTPLSLVTAQKNQSTLFGWTTTINNNEWLRFDVTSATTVTRIIATITIQRT